MNRINHSSRFFEQFSKPEITRVPLIDLCSLFIDGDWIEAKDQSDSGYRLVQTGNVGVCEYLDKKEHSRFVSEETFKRLNCTEIHSGDILFSRLPDPIGRCCIIPKDFPKAITAVDCTITRLKDNCLPEYLMIYTTTTMYSEQIKKCVTGTTRQRISRGNLAKITIPLPDKMKQVEFVNLVHQADKSKFNGFKSRFIEMFGNAEKTKPLSECIGTTFPGEWGEDDLDGSGVNVIRTTNFTNSGKLDLTNVVTRKIDQAKIDKKHLVPGDIILERSGGTADNPVGRVVYYEADGTFLFNNFTQILRCKDGVNSLFVFYSLFNYYHTHKNEIRSMGNKTTGIQNLKMDKYWDIPIADAFPEQQEQFVCLYKQADKSKYLN